MSDQKLPVFSVIMPVYNREELVMNAINSVLEQSFRNFELIIVDDHSKDDTIEVIRNINDDRIQLIALEENAGAAHARNVGINASRAEYITFLDSDDRYEPTYLEETYNVISVLPEEYGFTWCGTRMHTLDHDNKMITIESVWSPKERATPYLTLLHALQIGIGCGVTFKRKVFEEAGSFNESLPAAEDTEFFLRVSKVANFKVIDKPLVNIYKNGDDRMSTRFDNINKAYQKFIPEHMNVIRSNKELRSKFYYKLCWLAYHSKDKSQARQYFRELIKDDLFNRKAWLVFFLFEVLGDKKGADIHRSLSKRKTAHV